MSTIRWHNNSGTTTTWVRGTDSSGNYPAPTFRTPDFTTSGTSTGTDDCNESLTHTNAEKAVFHAVKGAKRMASDGLITDAVRVAGHAGRAYLKNDRESYDPDKSLEYLDDNFDDHDDTVISAAIDRAFEKIDNGSHVGGARIAVSIADRFVDGFDPGV